MPERAAKIRRDGTDSGGVEPSREETDGWLARLTWTSQRAAKMADCADGASHVLALAVERYPELGGHDAQMLGLLLGELAGRLEELAALTIQYSHKCPSLESPDRLKTETAGNL